ncbi:hypothetical protein ACP70R_007633 [Stipagrostis hirtigluma subsp. patula]
MPKAPSCPTPKRISEGSNLSRPCCLLGITPFAIPLIPSAAPPRVGRSGDAQPARSSAGGGHLPSPSSSGPRFTNLPTRRRSPSSPRRAATGAACYPPPTTVICISSDDHIMEARVPAPGLPRRDLTEKEHQRPWITRVGNVNRNVGSSSASPSIPKKSAADVNIPDDELKRYILDDSYLTGDDTIDEKSKALIGKFNDVAEDRCQVIRTRTYARHNRSKLEKKIKKCRVKVQECKALRKSIRDLGGPDILIPIHFKDDP